MKTSWVQLEQKLKGEEKMEIKEKLARLNKKIKGLERSFRETLETLTGTEENAPRIRERTRQSFERIATEPREERGFLGNKREDWTKPPKHRVNEIIEYKKTLGKRDSLGIRNNLKSRENKTQNVKPGSQDWKAVPREPQEVYRDYLAESKMKQTVRRIKERVEKELLTQPKEKQQPRPEKNKSEDIRKKQLNEPKAKKPKKSYCLQCVFLLRKGFPVKFCDCRVRKPAQKP